MCNNECKCDQLCKNLTYGLKYNCENRQLWITRAITVLLHKKLL